MITIQSITLPYLHFITCVIVPEKEGVGVPFPYVYHLQLNSLNINAKLVMVEVAPPHFHPTPKMSRRFFKTSPRFVLNTVMFF